MKNFTIKIFIITILLFICLTPFILPIFAEEIQSYGFSLKSYDDLYKYTIDDIKNITIDNDGINDLLRQCNCRTLCIHREAEATGILDVGEISKVLAYIDINPNGDDPNYAILTNVKNGKTFKTNKDIYAKLAYIATEAEQVSKDRKIDENFYQKIKDNNINNRKWSEILEASGVDIEWTKQYIFVSMFCYEEGGIRNDFDTNLGLPLPENQAPEYIDGKPVWLPYITGNAVYERAAEYAQNGVTSDGKVCKARILITGRKSMQGMMITSGKKVNPDVDVSVSKTIVNNRNAEIGDNVEFKITITNNGSQNVTMDVTDTYNTSEYKILKFNGENISNNSGTIVRNVEVRAKYKKEITVRMQLQSQISKKEKLTNTVRIDNFEINGIDVINKNKKIEDSDYYNLKKYKVSINKYVNKINTAVQTNRSTNKSETLYAEYGDTFEYKIVITNTGEANIKEINLIDIFNKQLIEVKSFSGIGWSGSGSNTGNQSTYNLTYSNGSGLASKKSTEITLVLEVNKKRTAPIVNTNKVTITSLKNKNGIEIKDYLEDGSNLVSSDKITLKGYRFGITKEIDAILQANHKNTNQKIYAEIGDVVRYKITIKNKGNNQSYGDIANISFNDIYNTTQLNCEEYELSEDKKIGTISGLKDGQITGALKENLKPGEETSVYFYMKVIASSKKELDISNTATLITAKNIRGEDILDVANPKSSTATFKLDTYNVELYKYVNNISRDDEEIDFHLNLSFEDKRKELSNVEKNNNPVEVEKHYIVEYKFILKNTSTRTTLCNPVLSDEFPEGIDFIEIKSANTTKNNNVEIKVDESKTKFTYNGVLEPNEELTIVIKTEIMKSNLYLPNIENILSIQSMTNRNEINMISENILNYNKLLAKDYVRMKNLMISGTVWLDSNENGYIDNEEELLQGIEVKLIDSTNGKYTTTTTDDKGAYKFGETNGIGSNLDKKMVEGEKTLNMGGTNFKFDNTGRVIKATNRDDYTGNYSEDSSEYIDYCIEFYYNGVKYTSTPKYFGRDNLDPNNNNMIKEELNGYSSKYKIDSNAREKLLEREEFNKSLETISYNKGMIEAEKNKQVDLSFTKNGHESILNSEKGSIITAYSFINNKDEIEKFFFGSPDKNGVKQGGTEYLKYINLGLVEREKLDLELTKDLMYTQVRINGQTLDYEYGKIPPGSSYYKKDGDKTDGSNETKYNMYLYKSDYYYRCGWYKNDEVIKAKGENSELQLDLTYKIAITNSSTNGNTFVKLREISDHYTDKMKIKDGSVYAVLGNRTINLNTDELSEYNNTDSYNFDGYRTKFIRGMDEVVLKNGETLEIYITYTVDKDYSEELELLKGQIYLGEKVNVAQISAYSTYTDESCEKPKGLVDINSNAGNVNTDAIKIDELDKYEDDTFRVRTDIRLKGNPSEEPPKDPEDPDNPPTDPDDPNNPNTPEKTNNERKISGLVFEDTRSEFIKEVKQYAGNGLYLSEDTRNTGLAELFRNNGMTRATDASGKVLQDLDRDTLLEGMTVELIEIVEVDGKIYEETLEYEEAEKATGENFANTIVQTNSDGEYTIESFIPGTYIVRFRYGDIYKDGTMTENSLIHNGQDYKSTTYPLTANGNTVEVENETDNKVKYDELTKLHILDTEAGKMRIATEEEIKNNKGKRTSDARDNEYRRLEIMAESETMTNEEAEFMKFTNYYNKDTNGKITKTEELEEFVKATNCFADTVAVTLGVEKYEDITERSEFTLRGMNKDYVGNTEKEEPKEKDYNSLIFDVKNIDFGLSYRPENFEKLTKKIKSIKLETSSGKVLVNLEYDMDGKEIKKEGLDKVQSIDTIGSMQGFRYINIDEELMQGTKVSIEYYMIAENIGEVDTVNKFLADKKSPKIVCEDLINSLQNYAKDKFKDETKAKEWLNSIYNEVKIKDEKTGKEITERSITNYSEFNNLLELLVINTYYSDIVAKEMTNREEYINSWRKTDIESEISYYSSEITRDYYYNNQGQYWALQAVRNFETSARTLYNVYNDIEADITTIKDIIEQNNETKLKEAISNFKDTLQRVKEKNEKNSVRYHGATDQIEISFLKDICNNIDKDLSEKLKNISELENKALELMQIKNNKYYEYGKFVGAAYYYGNDITEDEKRELTTAPITVERIIDWVDNDATFEAQNNSANGKYWTATSEGELVKNNLIPKEREQEENYYKDDKGRNYTSDNKKNIAINLDTQETNKTLIVPIYPVTSIEEKTSSHIVLEINAVLSAGSDDSDMVYDNVAEVAQFNTITGRRTNFASTIGNLRLVDESEDGKPKTPFEETQDEPDSSGTEVVSLIPPTGATVFRLFVIYNAKAIIGITAVLVIIFVAIKIRKYIIKRKNYLYK